MIRVQCPHCRRRYRTMTEAMGKTAVCTKCGEAFSIGESRPPFEWKPTDLGEDSWIGVVPPEQRAELPHCILCDAPMQPGEVRCPACGGNQVTGVVRKSRPLKPNVVHAPWWSRIPVYWLLAAAALFILATGSYLLFSWMGRSAVQISSGLAEQKLINPAVRFLHDGGDEYEFAKRFSGQVTDANLRAVLPLVNSHEPGVGKAATLLIANGQFTDVAPILALAESADHAAVGVQLIHRVGPRRLVELSNHSSLQVRQSAARGLALISELGLSERVQRELAEPASQAEKIHTLNELCRFRPQAVGDMVIRVANRRAPLTAKIEQIGLAFYARIGELEFRTVILRHRVFEIPIEQWCAATGTGVDPAELRKWVSGTVNLHSPLGVGWTGKMTLTVKTKPPHKLPGFVPIDLPEPGKIVEVPVTMDR